jgi:hypothetical protein
MAETSGTILKARALAAMGMPELALSAWLSAASGEEQEAPLLETLGRDREAAVHRLSAASCYQNAEEWGKAMNLYQAALAGPLLEPSRKEAKQAMAQCRARLARSANGSASLPHSKGAASRP